MDILEGIALGQYDDELSEIVKACAARMTAIPLQVGDTVQVNSTCRPQYMQGVKCTVVKVNVGRQRGLPVHLCEPLEEEQYKLAGTRMGAAYDFVAQEAKPKRIKMARDLINKI